MYGYDVRIVDESTGTDIVEPGRRASSSSRARRRPASCRPCGATTGRFVETYWNSIAGRSVYNTFDWGIRDADGYFFILGRTDDVINVAGHRLGTREIEESISSHPNVAEVAVVGVADALKGQVAMAFVIAKDASALGDAAARLKLEGDIMKTVDSQLGSVARPSRVHFVAALPKTRSGKLLRRAIQAICERRDPGDLTTIEDPTALQQIRDLARAGLSRCAAFLSFRLAARSRRDAVRPSPRRPAGPAFPCSRAPRPCRRLRRRPRRGRARSSASSRSTPPDAGWLAAWDDLNAAIEDRAAPVSFVENVHPDAAVRDAAQACSQRWSELGSSLRQNEILYRALLRLHRATRSSAPSSPYAREGVRGTRASRCRPRRRATRAKRDQRPHRRARPAVRRAHPRRERQARVHGRRARRRARAGVEGQARAMPRRGAARHRQPDPAAGDGSAPTRPRPASAWLRAKVTEGGDANLPVLAELVAPAPGVRAVCSA
jgi:hypothetical protein